MTEQNDDPEAGEQNCECFGGFDVEMAIFR